MNIKEAMKKLGVEKFYEFQKEVLDQLLDGRDAICIAPTGKGKSLIFQILPLLLDKLVVVIEPHLALELDQVGKLKRKGIEAAYINSLIGDFERRKILDKIEEGTLRLLYITPEMFQNKIIRRMLKIYIPGAIILDEAHCIIKQGIGFRESYLEIAAVVETIKPRPVVAAFTATATKTTAKGIMSQLHLNCPYVHIESIRRTNIRVSVVEVGHELGGKKQKAVVEKRKRELICKHISKVKHGKIIIYCNTVKRVEELCKYLQKKDYRAEFYHGQCDRKQARLTDFITGKFKIMVATNAFGLGVDIPDIRLIIHHSPLMGLDDYVQEIGRAGRDGKKSKAILLWHEYDFTINRNLLRKEFLRLTGRELEEKLEPIQALEDYVKNSQQCRWQQMRRFFGESAGKRCKCNCDYCKRKEELY